MRILLRTHPTVEDWDEARHAVVDLNPELAKIIARRHRALLDFRAADPALTETHYLDGAATFYDDLEPEVTLDDASLSAFWDYGWVELPADVTLDRLTPSRTTDAFLVIGSNYFQWVCQPANGNVQVFGEVLYLDMLAHVL